MSEELCRMNKRLEKYRIIGGEYGTKEGDNYGAFQVPSFKLDSAYLRVICSPLGDGEWDHVSVSLPNRCPTWGEMSKIKRLFFGEDVTAIQFHPKKSDYVNTHKYCLHLWRNTKKETELPPTILV